MLALAAIWALTVVSVSAQVGPSGIVARDGNNVQFDHDFANNIVLIGPSGIVTKNGRNLQLTDNQIPADFFAGGPPPSPVPVASYVHNSFPGAVIGPSGIVTATGRNIQFSHDLANNIAVVGPSGIVAKDGRNIQFNSDFSFANSRQKRSIGYVSRAGNVGTSGILRSDGTTDLFDIITAHDILLIGPSGIVLKDGRNIQLTDDLRIAFRG